MRLTPPTKNTVRLGGILALASLPTFALLHPAIGYLLLLAAYAYLLCGNLFKDI